jgi:hypothetical protein
MKRVDGKVAIIHRLAAWICGIEVGRTRLGEVSRIGAGAAQHSGELN